MVFYNRYITRFYQTLIYVKRTRLANLNKKFRSLYKENIQLKKVIEELKQEIIKLQNDG